MAILQKGNKLGVCVHHSVYTPAKNLTELKAHAKLYNTWHSRKDWAETIKTKGEFGYPYIEYHYLMATDGSLLQVQDEKYVLYHAGDNFRGDLSFNLHGIAVCLDGNYENDKPNDKQMLTLVKLIRDIEKRYDIDARIRGHKETSSSPTACPGGNIGTSKSGWLKQVITNVNNKDYPPVAPVDPCEKYKTENALLKSKVVEYEKQVNTLKGANTELRTQLEVLQDELDEQIKVCDSKYNQLKSEYNRVLREKGDCQLELSNLKDHRFNWLIEWLDKVIPKKND
jgi:N-acetyl-anhydromuramyl-L-alanine amidase AmpD